MEQAPSPINLSLGTRMSSASALGFRLELN